MRRRRKEKGGESFVLKKKNIRHKALQQELEQERHRSMSFDQDASLARETVNCMLDDVIRSLESEKADIRRALKTSSSQL